MKIIKKIKIGVAVLLLICIILPFTSCTRLLDKNGKDVLFSHGDPVKSITKYYYPWQSINLTVSHGWIALLCFIWPIPILIFQHRSNRKKLKFAVWLAEPLLIIGAFSYIDFSATFLATPAIGAYLMEGAYCIYGFAWMSELIIKVKNKRTNPTS